MKYENNVAVCFVADFKYLLKYFPQIYMQLREKGKYEGQVLVITKLLTPTIFVKFLRKKNKITILRFKKIKFDKSTNFNLSKLSSNPNRHNTKNFQWHKLYLFHKKIKQWKYIFYLDINMNIHHDINPIISIKPQNSIFARADSFPNYNWKLKTQFDNNHKLFKKLEDEYNLEITNYFQTGILYFDTNIVNDKTLREILLLIKKFPISITNEQGILNIYFIFEKLQYKELVENINGKLSYFYWKNNKQEVIISKALTEKNK